jgi:hypothetical protein
MIVASVEGLYLQIYEHGWGRDIYKGNRKTSSRRYFPEFYYLKAQATGYLLRKLFNNSVTL